MTLSAKHYLWLGHLLILSIIVWSGVNLGMTIFTHRLDDMAGEKAPIEISENLAPQPRSLREYENIVRENMFSLQPKKQTTTKEPAASPAPEPVVEKRNLNIRLRGTVISLQSNQSYAILETIKTRQQDLYRIGDQIDGAELVEVAPEEIHLRRDGAVEKLKIFEAKSTSSAQPPRRNPQRQRAPRTTPKPQASKIAQAVGRNRFIVNREVLNQDITDLYSLMSQVRIQPFLKNNQPHGFRVSSIRPNGVFYQLGIRNNDVVVKLNGIAVRQPDDIMGLYRQIQELDTVTVEIERRGRPVTLTYSLH
ncbi:MAG: type II secretion system protein GspC [Deltaproteobacteria bacterium]|nr:type II secretion system protein GspC [Deltaproteobacteria bacterium]